jgi:glutamyl-tRNA synthetase
MPSSPHVRFAPSPTGYIHVGNARIAVLNWLFAQHNHGQFSLRFDDTDQKRSSPHFVQAIKDDLSWLGISWDSEFSQASRHEVYERSIEALKKSGRLYPCFDTQEELNIQRKIQTTQGQPPLYNNKISLARSQDEINQLIKNGKNPHWRFLLSTQDQPAAVEWDDLVRGTVHFQELNMSDPVLVREDGCPLYTLTSVIDDIHTHVTHVIRGEDHVANTAVQMQIFQALDSSPPLFAHIPLLMDSEGKPLSKRIGSLSLRKLREDGLFPSSLFSYLANLGTNHAPKAHEQTSDLINAFHFNAFGRAAPCFDENALATLNRQMWPLLTPEDLQPLMPKEADLSFWNLIAHNISHKDDILHWWEILRHDTLPSPYTPKDEEELHYLTLALENLPSTGWDAPPSTQSVWQTWQDTLHARTKRKGKQLLLPLRLCLTSEHKGPDLASLLSYLGHHRTKARLKSSLHPHS